MSEQSEESKRISQQVTALSTQLIESIDKQSKLEEKLNHANKIIASQQPSLDKYSNLKVEFEKLKISSEDQQKELDNFKVKIRRERELRENAEQEVEKLSKEVEDLTATLFDEANNMVADARKDKYTVEVLNTKLVEQLHEKDNLLETLNLQLKNLKKVLQTVEDENNSLIGNNRYSIIQPDSATTSSSTTSLEKITTTVSSYSQNISNMANGIIYSPIISSIRYDLPLYEEFLKFIAVIPHCRTIKDTSSDSKLIRRLVNDEINPVLKLDNASGLGWIVRKTILSTMMEGLVVVEPLSGVNETFQMGNSTQPPNAEASNKNESQSSMPKLFKFPLTSPPIALHEPCSFCGESRDDIIEHARMYVLKTQNKQEDGTIMVTNTFPLCHWCLFKVRQTCEIFAFLRSLKTGVWNLEKVTMKSISSKDSSRFSVVTSAIRQTKTEDRRSKRMSFIGGLTKNSSAINTAQVESTTSMEITGLPTTNIQRAWIQLCKLRSILHWAHVGIWSIDDSITSKIGPEIKDPDDKLEPASIEANIKITKKQIEKDVESIISENNQGESFDFESSASTSGATEASSEEKSIAGESETKVHASQDNSEHQSANALEQETKNNFEEVTKKDIEQESESERKPKEAGDETLTHEPNSISPKIEEENKEDTASSKASNEDDENGTAASSINETDDVLDNYTDAND
ncbi:hypothetical protein NCAS_0A00580 [Naumovozyma castellii]|uniref:GDP/GTP exchange factor Sec2 N-terminal domain-containing protein n=1 Tax=Naumovozyma castellii TaxID=27288 RepID=G0V582_NAUCA|nr:hypothetical protein NCAS_0A00580 [Naumovozyma castellii CBS 4309]CCC66618.1 hypothetical protein NCAS_0A00580 [Naumovozyma castellii CBS 4309]